MIRFVSKTNTVLISLLIQINLSVDIVKFIYSEDDGEAMVSAEIIVPLRKTDELFIKFLLREIRWRNYVYSRYKN